MRVLLTGANGRIGRFVRAGLTDEGHDVTSTSRSRTPSHDNSAVRYLDLGKPIDERLFTGIDIVVHLAGIADRRSGATAEDFWRVNYLATLDLARSAQKAGVSRFIFASTILVHGDSTSALLTPSSPIAASDPYALSKARAEDALRSTEFAAISIDVLRLASVRGQVDEVDNSKELGRRIVERLPVIPVPMTDNKRASASLESVLAGISTSVNSSLIGYHVHLISDGETGFRREVEAAVAATKKQRLVLPIPLPCWRLLDRVSARLGGPSLAGAFADLRVACSAES